MSNASVMIYDAEGRLVPAPAGPVPLQATPIDEPSTIDVRGLWAVLYRNRVLILAVVGAAAAIGLILTMLTTPIYSASTSVQVDQQAAKVLEKEGEVEAPESIQDADRFLQTQIDIVRSRSLATQVADALGLFNGDQFRTAMGVRPRDDGAVETPTQKRAQIIKLLQDNLSVSLPRNSRLMTLSFASPDPATAARVANAYADRYAVSNLQRKFNATSYARTFLQGQLGEAKRRLEQAERASIDYARSAGLLDVSNAASTGPSASGDSGSKSLTTTSLVQINTSLTDATARRIAAEQRWSQASGTPALNLPEVQSNSTVQQLLQQRAQAQANYQEELQRHKEDFPTMRQAAAEIAALDRQIATISGQIKDSIRDQYAVAAKQEAALRSNVGSLRGQTLSEQDRGVRLNILRREVDTSRTLYDGLLQRFREVSAAAGVAANNVSIVDEAEVPLTPVSPRLFVNLAMALLIGTVGAVALVFIREALNEGIRSADDVDRKLKEPFLGTVPLLRRGETAKEALSNPRSPFSEAYASLRSSLEFATVDGLPRNMVVTSSQQSEGKSTSALALAQTFARVGTRVLLIDGDLRKPSLHRVLGVENRIGLVNVLVNQMTIDQVARPTGNPNLSFVSSGPTPPNPAELLARTSLRGVLAAAGRNFDLVIVDGPPVMGFADAPLLANAVEGVVFVVDSSRTRGAQVKLALRRLHESRGTVLGVVLTKYDARQIGYYENYGYSYRYGETAAPDQGKRFSLPRGGRGKAEEDADAESAAA